MHLDINCEELRRTSEPPQRKETSRIIVHHTSDLTDMPVVDLNEEHITNGWAMIGYNYIVHKDGSVDQGRDVDAIGMHCIGCNGSSVGISLCGDFNIEEPSNEQLASLKILLEYLCDKYNLEPSKAIIGHNSISRTSCPGVNLLARLGSVVSSIKGIK